MNNRNIKKQKNQNKGKYSGKDHTFVICAYKESPYIEETIVSLKNQTVPVNIIMSTATPNEFLNDICKKYEIPLYVNDGERGIAGDWNFGYQQAKTKLVTLAHQDDFYEPEYAEEIIRHANMGKDVIVVYSDYYEYRIDKKVTDNKLLKIKRMMNLPMTKKIFYGNRFVRRLMLSLGDPICCPAVTYVKERVGDRPFDTSFQNSCDYKAMVEQAEKKGWFICVPRQLMAHRIHPGSTTTLNLSENIRQKEDLEIFCRFWPRPIAKLLNRVYATSERSNEL